MPQFDIATFPPQIFWLAVTFLVLYLVMALVGLPRVGGIIKRRREHISDDLDKAQRMKAEAEAVIAAYERALAEARTKAQETMRETMERLNAEAAEAIIAQARDEALRAAEEAKRDLAASLERRKRMAVEKLALDEQKAIQDVRNTAVDVAVAAVRHVLAHDLDAKRRAGLIDEAIAALPETLH